MREKEDGLERLRNEKDNLEVATRAVEAKLHKCEADLTEAGEKYEERSEWLHHLEKEMREQGWMAVALSHFAQYTYRVSLLL